MAQRTVALCNGKYIGIETIYTVINGRQINIPEKLKELSEYSVAAKPPVRKNGNHLSG